MTKIGKPVLCEIFLPVFGKTTSSGEVILFGFTSNRSGEADVAEIGPFVIPGHGISAPSARSGSGSGYVIQDHICRRLKIRSLRIIR